MQKAKTVSRQSKQMASEIIHYITVRAVHALHSMKSKQQDTEN